METNIFGNDKFYQDGRQGKCSPVGAVVGTVAEVGTVAVASAVAGTAIAVAGTVVAVVGTVVAVVGTAVAVAVVLQLV